MSINRQPTTSGGPGECSVGFTGLQLTNITVITIAVAVSIVLVSLRFYVRKRYVGALWFDDWTMLAATLLLLPYGILLCYFSSVGFGQHYACVPPADAHNLFKNGLALDIFCFLSLSVSRASVGLLLIRLFAIKTSARYMLWSLIIFQALVTIITIGLISPRCDPIEKLWDPEVEGTCFSVMAETVALYLNGATSIFSDFVLALAPVHILWNIQMSPRNKATVCVLLGLGFIPAGSAFARTIYGSREQAADPTYTNAWSAFALSIESSGVIISGTIWTLRSFATLRKPVVSTSNPSQSGEMSSSRRMFTTLYTKLWTPSGSRSREGSSDVSSPSMGGQVQTVEIPMGAYKVRDAERGYGSDANLLGR